MRPCYTLIAAISFAFAFQVSTLHADQWVETEGIARVEKDVAISRNLAVLRAKEAALESLGIGINSKSIAVKGRFLDEMIMVQTSGFVKDYSILEEGIRDDYYYVRLKARVKEGKARKDAFGSLFNGRTVTITANGPDNSPILNQLKRGFQGRFYYFDDSGTKISSPDFTVALNSSVKYYSEYDGIRSFCVTASISMLQSQSGRQVVFATTGTPALIYGANLDQAVNGNTVNQYTEKVAWPLLDSFWKKLDRYKKSGSIIIRITVSDLPDQTAFQAFRDYVKNICLGMEGVVSERYAHRQGILDIKYREKSLYLASIIAYRPEYHIVGHGWDSIDVLYVER